MHHVGAPHIDKACKLTCISSGDRSCAKKASTKNLVLSYAVVDGVSSVCDEFRWFDPHLSPSSCNTA
jgi:hypothetical protein